MPAKKDLHAVKYDARSFTIRGKRELLIGGEFHYFRTPHELWEDRIIKMKRSGANLVTTYIPWNWHEPFEGQERWSGDQDLVRFIELCTRHGLFLILKPGPYCCAELDFGGHPDWLLGKKVPLRVLNDKYLKYVEKWYGRVADVIRPYLATNGGNVFCLQVENEYDHLIHYGEDKITLKDAVTYFMRLKKIMEQDGLDLPKFANEAEFLRGKGIIDTRTYYPNIPFFGDWMWQFEHFDDKIMRAKSGQPDSPTMILELQVAWFGMHGQPWYFPGLDLTEGVTKSVVMEGASVLNYYMFVGGTTFPFWGSRGNVYGVKIPGFGLTTSFDFGGSPVREWGELMPERYDWIKGFTRFTRDYQDLLLSSDNVEDLQVLSGGEQVQWMHLDRTEPDTTLSHATEKFKVITRRRGEEMLACIRNLSGQPKTVSVGRAGGEAVFPQLTVGAHETLLFPVNVKVPGADLTVVRSTSELAFVQRTSQGVMFGLSGRAGREGETILSVPAGEVRVLSGRVEIGDAGGRARLRYTHQGIQILKVRGHLLFLLEKSLAGKVEGLQDGLLIADAYWVKEIQEQDRLVRLTVDLRNGSENRFHYFGPKALQAVTCDGRPVEVRPADGTGSVFSVRVPKEEPLRFAWQGDWKLKTDTAEIQPKYPDRSWTRLKKPVSLEEAGLLEHGYHWYRAEFEVPAGAKDVMMFYPGNATDRQYVFVNGRLVWSGITTLAEINLQGAVKTGKNVLAVCYQNFFHNKSHPHEGAIKKYSGIMQPVVVKGQARGKAFRAKITEFKVRQQLTGVLDRVTELGYDDGAWQTVPAGRKYLMGEELGVLVWLRRKFSFRKSPGWTYAVKLVIPMAEQRCFAYVNGKAVAWYESAGPQNEFYIPEPYLQDENVLVILLEGPKGFLEEPRFESFFEAKENRLELRLA